MVKLGLNWVCFLISPSVNFCVSSCIIYVYAQFDFFEIGFVLQKKVYLSNVIDICRIFSTVVEGIFARCSFFVAGRLFPGPGRL